MSQSRTTKPIPQPAAAPRGPGFARNEALFITVLLGAHLPFLLLHLVRLWRDRPDYRLLPVLLAGIAYLGWQRVFRRGRPPEDSWLATMLFLCGLVLGAAAAATFSPGWGAVAALLSAGGVFCRYAGRAAWRDWLPVWALTWLILPLPLAGETRPAGRLQSSAVQMASMVLEVRDVPHLIEGRELVLIGHRVPLDAAGGGPPPAALLLAGTALFVVAARRPLLWSLMLLISSVGWAWLAAVAVIVGVVVGQLSYDADLSSGWPQILLHFGALALSVLMLVCTDRGLAFLLGRIEPPADDEDEWDPEHDLPWLARTWNRLVGGRQLVARDATDADAAHCPAAQTVPPRRWLLGGFALLAALQVVCLLVHPARSDPLSYNNLPAICVPAGVPVGQAAFLSGKADRCGGASD